MLPGVEGAKLVVACQIEVEVESRWLLSESGLESEEGAKLLSGERGKTVASPLHLCTFPSQRQSSSVLPRYSGIS